MILKCFDVAAVFLYTCTFQYPFCVERITCFDIHVSQSVGFDLNDMEFAVCLSVCLFHLYFLIVL